MVEDIEVLYAHIELDALGQVEPPAQGQIGLVDGVNIPQPVAGEVSRQVSCWSRKCIRIQCLALRLGRIRDPQGLPGTISG